jgi:hypothetical protein
MIANLLQIALLAGLGCSMVSIGVDLLKTYSYEQLSERYGIYIQAELENRLPETRLAKLRKNGASRWMYRRLVRHHYYLTDQ